METEISQDLLHDFGTGASTLCSTVRLECALESVQSAAVCADTSCEANWEPTPIPTDVETTDARTHRDALRASRSVQGENRHVHGGSGSSCQNTARIECDLLSVKSLQLNLATHRSRRQPQITRLVETSEYAQLFLQDSTLDQGCLACPLGNPKRMVVRGESGLRESRKARATCVATLQQRAATTEKNVLNKTSSLIKFPW